jgi:NADH dehydrogenase
MKAAQKLARKPVHVTLIDKRNYHLFQPLLYQVATAGISPHEIAYPVRAIFQRHKNIAFLMARVNGVDFERKVVRTEQGEVGYDYLIIAAGASVNYFENASLEQNALPLKDVSDAVQVRNHVLRMFELAAQEQNARKRQALLTFVIAGGGPTGVESAGAFSELIRLVLRKDYPNLNMDDVRIILLEAVDTLLAGFPSKLQDSAREVLAAKHVEVRLHAKVSGYDAEAVSLADGSSIPTRTLLWSAGVQVASIYNHLGVEQTRQGRVKVLPSLQLPTHPEVFIAGDAAYIEENGQPLPMMGTVAFQQGTAAAENILRAIKGQPLKPFKFADPGSLATIGRNAAVARIGRWQFRGFPAWVVWLVVHLIGLIGFRNRLIVLINWTWDYFFYDRAVRLITRE